MSFRRELAVTAVLLGHATLGQPQGRAIEPASPEFEAASVKPSKAEGKLFAVRVRGARLTANGANLKDLITDAYQIQGYQISRGPKWFDSDGFDIEAVAANVPTRDRFRLMLRTLLADRFKLKFHREFREVSIYGLVVAKDGPKFHERKNGEGIPPGPWGVGHIRFRDLSVLAAGLSIFSSDRPVLDKTGLTGNYDLEIVRPLHPDPGEPDGEKTTAGEELLRAAQEQLGLKLVPMKSPIEMFVIDYVEKPSAN